MSYAPRQHTNQPSSQSSNAQSSNAQSSSQASSASAQRPNYDKNHGIISGLVSSVQAKTGGAGTAAVVTLAGLCSRVLSNGTVKEVPFFEQVKFFGRAAENALQLQPGEAVIVNNAHIAQEQWVTESGERRSKLMVYGASFMRLTIAKTDVRHLGKSRVLNNAMNEFIISGRLVRDAVTKTTAGGAVTELNIASNRDTPKGRENHVILTNIWDCEAASTGKTGAGLTVMAMITTHKRVIDGKERYFTQMEARSVAMSKPFGR